MYAFHYGEYPMPIGVPIEPRCPVVCGVCQHSGFPISRGGKICTVPHDPALYRHHPVPGR